MEYIPDKKLYSAVMFSLKMCPNLQHAYDSKISLAAKYYKVNYDDVLEIVRKELWKRAVEEAKKDESSWYTIFNPFARDLINTGIFNDYVFICPHCGRHYACNVHNDNRCDELFTSQCICGFVDKDQREFIRKDYFERELQRRINK